MSMIKRCYLILGLLYIAQLSSAQQVIEGVMRIDGIYKAAFSLELVEPSFYQGYIRYDVGDTTYSLVANEVSDTLHVQELDHFMNPTAKMYFTNIGEGAYQGEWYDEAHRVLLPARIYPEPRALVPPPACRYDITDAEQGYQVLHTLPLSDEVAMAQLIHQGEAHCISAARISDGDTAQWYAQSGSVQPRYSALQQEVAVQPYLSMSKAYSLEALLPAFDKPWVDSMQHLLHEWQDKLSSLDHPDIASRFPARYYLLLDIDHWTEEWLAGTVEIVGPAGSLAGHHFIYSIEQSRFMSVDDLFKGGEVDLPTRTEAALPGWSMNHYALLDKGPFHHIEPRVVASHDWSIMNRKLKKQVEVRYK